MVVFGCVRAIRRSLSIVLLRYDGGGCIWVFGRDSGHLSSDLMGGSAILSYLGGVYNDIL